MTRRGVWNMSGVVCLSMVLVGCGDADRSSLKDYSEPLKAVDRVELLLGRLAERMTDASDPIDRETIASSVQARLKINLPYSMKAKVRDAAVRDELVAKADALLAAFEDRVYQPLLANPVDLPTAREGVAECQALVGEMAVILGRRQ